MDKTPTEKSIERVRAWLGAKEMKRKDFMAIYGVSRSQIHEARQPGWNPTADLLSRFERAIPDDWEPSESQEAA